MISRSRGIACPSNNREISKDYIRVLQTIFQKYFHVPQPTLDRFADGCSTHTFALSNLGYRQAHEVTGVDPFGLLVRQRSDSGMELLHRNFTLINLAGRHGHKEGFVLNAIAPIQRVMSLVVVCTAAICCFQSVILLHDGSYFIRDFNNIVCLIKIRILFSKVDFCHIFPPFRLLGE